MRKLLLAFFILFGLAVQAEAQVSAVTVTGPVSVCANSGDSISVTFTITQAADFNSVNYDILFSAATTATTGAYSSFLGRAMVCSSTDSGYFFNNVGQISNTVVKRVSVPNGFGGNIIVIAKSNTVYLSCTDTQGRIAFTNPCPTSTATFTSTSTFTKTFTATKTNTPTATFTATATKTPTCDVLSTPICGNQFTPTFTFTATKTFTATATSTSTNTKTNTFTFTATKTPTRTFTNTPTNANTVAPTATPTHQNMNQWVAFTPTGTITPPPDGNAYWKPWDGSNPYTPTYTPTPNYTTSPSPTPVAISFNINTASSSPQTIASAVSGCYLTIRRFVVTNTNASTAGAFYISDGTVTLSGPLTIGSGNSGLNINAPTYSAGFNRPLIFFNAGAVTNLMIAGQYSIDLPNQQIRGCQ